MASFFHRVKEGIRNVTTPLDELDRHFANVVERATSDVLIGPDWTLNLELVDQINNNPTVCSEKVCRAIRKTLISNNTRVQMLTLTLLETVVKNADARFHEHFADSELFAEMQLMADPQPQYKKMNAEVRDRILTLIENLAKAVTHVPYFREAYEALLDRGVDFPVRSPDDDLPFTVRAPTPRITEPRAGGITAEALAGLSEEDRRAIQQAMLELDHQAHSQGQLDAQQQAAIPHAAMVCPQTGPGQPAPAYAPPPISHLGPTYGQPQSGYAPPGTVYAPPAAAYSPALAPHQQPGGPVYGQQDVQTLPTQPPPPADPEETKNMLEVVKNSRELLTEMLLSLPADDLNAVREPYITELAGQVKRMKSQLESAIHRATDELLLSGAITEHEEVQRVIQQYNDALARVSPPGATQGEGHPPVVQPGHLFSGAPIYPGAQFSISDDEVDGTLQTRRGAAPVIPPPTPTPPQAGTDQPQQSLINLDSPTKRTSETVGVSSPTVVLAPPATDHPAAHAEDPLVQQFDQLVMRDNKDGENH